MAHRQEEEALLVMDEIRHHGDPVATARAGIQISILYLESGADKRAEEALRDAASTIEERLCGGATVDCLEVQLQVARVWQRIGQDDRARHAYATLINELDSRECPAGSVERHIAAIAEYRLADLQLDERPGEALERWRHVVELHDEEVSPYAALRMTQEFGEGRLVGERVEKLFHYAMGTSDPRLFAEASIGLARHLKDHNQFSRSRHYLDTVLEGGYDEDLIERARAELAGMDSHEDMVVEVAPLRRLWSLQVKARDGLPDPLDNSRRVIIVGAGTGGCYLRESLDPRRYTVCGFVDDNATEVSGDAGDAVLGRIADLGRLLSDIQPHEVLLAIPTLSGGQRREVVLACRQAGTPLLNLPGMHELGIGWGRDESRHSLMSQLRQVKVAEILGDERRALDPSASNWLQYRTVLVIGAGAIGTELCRRLADAEVLRLVIVDQRESALKKIKTELREIRKFPPVDVRLGSAAKPGFLAAVFESCSPYVVFNATGDASPEAFDRDRLLRDPFGWMTLFTNEAAVAWEASRAATQTGVSRVVHISTRRAGVVHDSLGAMKAICEELFLYQAMQDLETRNSVVRIGAVLDSRNGRFSTLEDQIRSGTIVKAPPLEARAKFVPMWHWAELILHAGRLADGGDVFEPDGGVEITPRKVVEDAIELADLFVEDVVIEETSERWDEPPAPAACRCESDWPDLGIWKLKRPAAGADRLQTVVTECAHWIDEDVAAGSGEAAKLVLTAVECLQALDGQAR
ncbi:MAG TPA: polysaccharide biosynthesis protein [Solirubrobacterales bacterium]|nr:polysaccharide biosynthesis protein [Solirubrobacterales bacterium]